MVRDREKQTEIVIWDWIREQVRGEARVLANTAIRAETGRTGAFPEDKKVPCPPVIHGED